jgi:hypothetical protein
MSFSSSIQVPENGPAGQGIAEAHHTGSRLEENAESIPPNSGLGTNEADESPASILKTPRRSVRKMAINFGLQGDTRSEVISKSPTHTGFGERNQAVLKKDGGFRSDFCSGEFLRKGCAR